MDAHSNGCTIISFYTGKTPSPSCFARHLSGTLCHLPLKGEASKVAYSPTHVVSRRMRKILIKKSKREKFLSKRREKFLLKGKFPIKKKRAVRLVRRRRKWRQSPLKTSDSEFCLPSFFKACTFGYFSCEK